MNEEQMRFCLNKQKKKNTGVAFTGKGGSLRGGSVVTSDLRGLRLTPSVLRQLFYDVRASLKKKKTSSKNPQKHGKKLIFNQQAVK